MSGPRSPIPVNLVTGFLGVGKTTAIRHLLARHPADERWAVLVNEFGEVGVDGALLADEDIVVQEVAGGCLCCVAAPAFTTGLNRLIREQAPARILIEPSGLGHPAQVLQTLSGPLYAGILEVRATICLIDPQHLDSPRHREHPVFMDQVHLADVLVANKTDLCGQAGISAFERFATGLAPRKRRLAMIEQGRLDPAWLDLARSTERRAAFPEAHAFLIDAERTHGGQPAGEVSDWQLIEGAGDGYRRAGWLIRQHAPWPSAALRALLDRVAVERKKGIFLTDDGWLACNQTHWATAKAPSDGQSRLELIDAAPLPVDEVEASLAALDGQSPG